MKPALGFSSENLGVGIRGCGMLLTVSAATMRNKALFLFPRTEPNPHFFVS